MRPSKRLCACRPYSRRIRSRVFSALHDLGYDLAGAEIIPPGTSNREAAARLDRASVDLFLVPFHVHRGHDDSILDGLQVLRRLSANFHRRAAPILMPVSQFSLQSSFSRRWQVFSEERTLLAERTVLIPENRVSAQELRERLEQLPPHQA